MKKLAISLSSFALLMAFALNLTACVPKVQAADLMAGITGDPVQGKDSDANFIAKMADFAIELFRRAQDQKKSSLVSPLSVLLALAMTANGADGQTLAEMEAVLGKDIPLAELNEYLYTLANNLPSEEKAKLSIANSIWFRDDESLKVEKDFLQRNADYYQASAFKSPFDQQTLRDINRWVEKNTEGMIEDILDEIDSRTIMYLINAVAFVAEWEKAYTKNDTWTGDFTNSGGGKQTAKYMNATESLYLEDSRTTGFIKPYANGKYSFAALLPNEGITIEDYIADLSGNHFLNIIQGAQSVPVATSLPKFSYDYTIRLNDALVAMGMPQAFSPEADFSRLGQAANGNIFIGEVLHKTFIQVDEQGTKAAAVTKVDMKCTSVLIDEKVVVLDRPFVYAIIDNASNLPIFIGAVMEIAD